MEFSEMPKKITWETVPENWYFGTLECMFCGFRAATHFCKLYREPDMQHVTVALCDACMRLPEVELRDKLFPTRR